MIGVLFVCLGNICRSPMAEAIFRKKIREQGLQDRIRIDSAGTSGWHEGAPPHAGTRRILSQHAIDYSGIHARQVREADAEEFDYIVVMDANNLEDLGMTVSTKSGRAPFRLLDLNPDADQKNVPDPYYTGNFEEVYDMIDDGCDRLIALIKQNEGW